MEGLNRYIHKALVLMSALCLMVLTGLGGLAAQPGRAWAAPDSSGSIALDKTISAYGVTLQIPEDSEYEWNALTDGQIAVNHFPTWNNSHYDISFWLTNIPHVALEPTQQDCEYLALDDAVPYGSPQVRYLGSFGGGNGWPVSYVYQFESSALWQTFTNAYIPMSDGSVTVLTILCNTGDASYYYDMMVNVFWSIADAPVNMASLYECAGISFWTPAGFAIWYDEDNDPHWSWDSQQMQLHVYRDPSVPIGTQTLGTHTLDTYVIRLASDFGGTVQGSPLVYGEAEHPVIAYTVSLPQRSYDSGIWSFVQAADGSVYCLDVYYPGTHKYLDRGYAEAIMDSVSVRPAGALPPTPSSSNPGTGMVHQYAGEGITFNVPAAYSTLQTTPNGAMSWQDACADVTIVAYFNEYMEALFARDGTADLDAHVNRIAGIMGASVSGYSTYQGQNTLVYVYEVGFADGTMALWGYAQRPDRGVFCFDIGCPFYLKDQAYGVADVLYPSISVSGAFA